MTFILALSNPNQTIQVSDRRLSSNGRIVDDNFNKAIVLLTQDARQLVGFTGLARFGAFDTRKWIAETLLDCCPPDYRINNIARRFKERASDEFQSHPILRWLRPSEKRLGILFSGYNYYMTPPLGAFGILTNYQDFQINEDDPPGVDSDEAREEFEMHYFSEHRPLDYPFTAIQYVGNWRAFDMAEEPKLRKLLRERRSTKAIINKAVSIIRQMADRQAAAGTIGKNLSVSVLRRDVTTHVDTLYFAEDGKKKEYSPDYVIGISDQIRALIENKLI